jgi:poly(hydroxyalkanoate) depolymerase family esterase
VKRLGAVVLALLVALPAVPARAAAPGSFTHHRYGPATSPFSRTYWLYVPTHRARPAPVVVYLHGCLQDGRDAAIGTRWNELAEKNGFIAVYPDQRVSDDAEMNAAGYANGTACWNFFQPSSQVRGGGEAAAIAGITRAVVKGYRGDPKRTYISGASAGAAMATVMGAAYPDLYAALGLLAGCPYMSCSDSSGMRAYEAMGKLARRMPVFVMHGTADNVLNVTVGHQLTQAWLGTNDLADNKEMDGSIPRDPASVAHHGIDESLADGLGAPNDTCVRNHQWPCLGGVWGAKSYPYTKLSYADANDRSLAELWIVHGLAHNYPGGNPKGTFTDPHGPSATTAAWNFFATHPGP